jgi:hypothetical protein
VGHVRIEEQRLAFVKLLLGACGINLELSAEAVNDHLSRSLMLGKLATRLECEEHQPEGAAMDQTCLAMSMDGRMRFRVQGTSERTQVERDLRSR